MHSISGALYAMCDSSFLAGAKLTQCFFYEFQYSESTFWLLVSQYFRNYFLNYFQHYFRNYFRSYFQNSFQTYSLFLWMPITWGTTSKLCFSFSGRSLADSAFVLLVLIQRNTFWLPIRFLFMFPKLFPELFPELFPKLFPKIFPKLSPNLLPKLLPNLFPKFCQH